MKKILLIIILVLFFMLLFLLYLGTKTYHPYLSDFCEKTGSTAIIAWKRTLPLYLIDVHLLVKNKQGTVVFQKLLLEGRDHYGDIEVEFEALNWNCSDVKLKVNRNHYNGPLSIAVPLDE